MVIAEADIAEIDKPKREARSARPDVNRPAVRSHGRSVGEKNRAEVDLHGLTVEEALVRAEDALNKALVEDCAELRVIHGRSGGRIRAALHRRLREMPSVRGFGLDPGNSGVTIVKL